jgi:hypothetical protein
MSTKSRETIYGASVRAAAERAREARKQADRLACEAWNKRLLAFKGPAQPSPTLGDALDAGFGYLEVKCLGCDTHQTVALETVATKDNAGSRAGALHAAQGLLSGARLSVQAHHLMALRPTKISASEPASTWWPRERCARCLLHSELTRRVTLRCGADKPRSCLGTRHQRSLGSTVLAAGAIHSACISREQTAF